MTGEEWKKLSDKEKAPYEEVCVSYIYMFAFTSI